ncbi:U38-like protein [Lissonota sp. PSUC_FEM 10030012]|nr:U38-like protein [Lissonota sp. PSUC_FEM 10030012]
MSFEKSIGVLNIALENVERGTNVLDLCDERLEELRQQRSRYYTVVPIIIAEYETSTSTSEELMIRELVGSSTDRYAALPKLPSVSRIRCYENILRRQYIKPESQLKCALMMIMTADTYQRGSLETVAELASYKGDMHLYFLVLHDAQSK